MSKLNLEVTLLFLQEVIRHDDQNFTTSVTGNIRNQTSEKNTICNTIIYIALYLIPAVSYNSLVALNNTFYTTSNPDIPHIMPINISLSFHLKSPMQYNTIMIITNIKATFEHKFIPGFVTANINFPTSD